MTKFRLNSDLSQLINQNAPWRVDFDRFEATFPDLVRTAVIVIDSASIGDVERVTRTVVDQLENDPQRYKAIAAPGSETFFRDHALLYMDLDDLDDMADRLAEAQTLAHRNCLGS